MVNDIMVIPIVNSPLFPALNAGVFPAPTLV